MSLKSGHNIVPVIYEDAVKQYEQFRGNRVGTIRLDPDGWFLTSPFTNFANKYFEFKFKPTDIVIVTYPKCGTTWTQEIVWTMVYNPNLDHPRAVLPVNARCPFMELDFLRQSLPKPFLKPGKFLYDTFSHMHPNLNPDDGIFLQMAEHAEDPRIIKSHLPFSLLSPSLLQNSKVIYVVRDPKDVAVSYCHHSRLFKVQDFTGTNSDFVDHFINDTLMYSPFWKHVQEAWDLRNQSNVHFIFYEDMKADPKTEILLLQKFLNLNLNESQIDNIIHYTSFDVMKKREEKNLMRSEEEMAEISNVEVEKKDGGFFRKGISGDYKNKLSSEDIEKLSKWTKENTQEMESDFKYKIKNVELIKLLFNK
ncbi:Sulfotransferase 1C1 [Armadillidium nasatum]|uniref:Sulfotransferase 1C1 n=1 Tax=Armadillidium nasatum TaxID=96803 RepID=A0A5N5T7N3_9CRUS|nr:Sulfotransferase 1C1 [Armadillidium nasatum]